MADRLAQFVTALAERASWAVSAPDERGVYHFYLEDGIDLDLQSPDGRTCIASADLGEAPEDTPEGETELRRIALISGAALQTRRSRATIAAGRLELFRSFALNEGGDYERIAQVRDFLNDQAWWKEALAGPGPSASPFSMFPAGGGEDWFPSQLQF